MTRKAGAPKFLVLGCSGMAGHVVTTYLRERGYDVAGLSGHTPLDDATAIVDVTDRAALLDFLATTDTDIVVNCIGALVEDSIRHPDKAAYLNAYLPHLLESVYEESSTRVFHLSTDCVFSGRTGHYREDAKHDGPSFYDRSKSLGELANGKDLTIRTSIVGPEIRSGATGLMNWALNSRGDVQGFRRSIWNGISTLRLAEEIERLAAMPRVTGVVHPVPSDSISKYELLQLFRGVFGLEDLQIQSVDGKEVDKTLIATREDYRARPADFDRMIVEMREWMLRHEDLYHRLPWYQRIASS